MRKTAPGIVLFSILSLFGFCRGAHAQWAVVDVGAIAQLVQQVKLLEQELQTAQNDLNQARAAYQSTTGSRGMQNLLAGTVRNYLSPTWSQLGTSLAAPVQAQVNANAVLSTSQVAALSPAEQQQLATARQNAALLEVATQEAYATTSSRFASIQQLIDAIPTATDQKGILDLQARIEAEQGMLRNDATKLNLLYQAAEAEEWARRQSAREQAVASVGNLRNLPALALP